MYCILNYLLLFSYQSWRFFQPFAGDHGHDHSHNHDGHNHGHEHGHEHGHNHDGHNHEKPSELTSLIVSEGHGDHHEHRDAENDHNRNINLHAAYLHVLGDLAQSVAVCLGGMTCVLPRCKE